MADMLKMYDVVIETHVGVHEWERKELQKIWLDLELPIDARAAAAADDVHRVVDYGTLVTQVRQHVSQRTYHLMETIAEETAQLILEHFPTDQVQVRVKKRALPGIDHACVEVLRTRADLRRATVGAPHAVRARRGDPSAGQGGRSRRTPAFPTAARR